MGLFQKFLANIPIAVGKAKGKSRELTNARNSRSKEEQQKEYENARQSILGEFSSSPIRSCEKCMAADKAERRKSRIDLIRRASLSCPAHASEAERLRKDMDEVEYMRCAKQVYLTNDLDAPEDLKNSVPPGFKRATPDDLAKMGLSTEMLLPSTSHFKAQVFLKDPAVWGESPDPAAVLAFRGSTPAQEDWDNNFAQNANRHSDYYERAVQIGNTLAESGAKVHIVGHSLAGGMASAAQGASGLTASTYNAAGLNPKTVARYSRDKEHVSADDEKITAIRIKGEALTKTQEEHWLMRHGASKVAGKKRDLEPAHDEQYWRDNNVIRDGDDYETYLHGMDVVIASMEEQKMADESALRSCIGTS